MVNGYFGGCFDSELLVEALTVWVNAGATVVNKVAESKATDIYFDNFFIKIPSWFISNSLLKKKAPH